jgi:stage II sporulation protein GA (sporulation sigma-E factor processing peptidase)
MTVYLDGVILLNFLVDFLLLLGADRLCGYPAKWKRAVLAALIGGVYAGACLLPGFQFLGNLLWRMVSFGAMSVIAYGFHKSAFRRGLVFVFLTLALGGAVTGIGKGGFLGILCAAGVVCLLCCFGFRGRIGGSTYVPVELKQGDKHLRLTALQDTGNTLRDPLTGRQVLVIDADTAGTLTGLTREQLRDPVGSLGALPGLRLIPYRSIDGRSFLLAMRMQNVKIGTWQGSSLVAFAPETLGTEGAYQALTGGAL